MLKSSLISGPSWSFRRYVGQRRAEDKGVAASRPRAPVSSAPGIALSTVIVQVGVAAERLRGAFALAIAVLVEGGSRSQLRNREAVTARLAELVALVARYHSGEPFGWVERNLLCVPGPTPQYGFLFGNGLLSAFLEVWYEGSEPTPAKAAWLLGHAALSAMDKDGKLTKRKYRLIGPVVRRVTLAEDPAAETSVPRNLSTRQ